MTPSRPWRSERPADRRGMAHGDPAGLPRADEVPVPIVLRIGRVCRRPAWGWHWCSPGQLASMVDRLLEHGYRFVDLTEGARRLVAAVGGTGASADANPSSPELTLLFEDSCLDFADLVWPVLEARSLSCALAVHSARVGRRVRRRPGPWSGSTRLNWSELDAFAAAGVHIVACGHTGVSHAQLPVELAFGDLMRCRKETERRLGKAPTTFLYGARPHPSIVDLVARAGFDLAIGSHPPRRASSAWELGSVSLRCSDRPSSWPRRLSAIPCPTVLPRPVDVGGASSFSAKAN